MTGILIRILSNLQLILLLSSATPGLWPCLQGLFERFNLMHVHSSLVAVPCTLSWSSLSYKAKLPSFISPCSWDVSVDSFVLLHSTCTDLQLAHPAQATPVCVCARMWLQ